MASGEAGEGETREHEAGARQGRKASASSIELADPYIQMESVHDRLGLLEFYAEFAKPRNQTVHKWQFAIEPENASVQFQLFLDVCSWLCEKISGDKNFFLVDPFDDPNTCVNQLLLAIRRLDFQGDFPSSKLKQGHGAATCSVLDFLSQKAVEKCFEWQPPIYPEEEEEEAEVDEGADVGDGIEDEIEAAYDDDDEAMFQEAAPQEEEEDPEYEEAHQILKSGIDPVVWQAEVERVAARLRYRVASGGNEWRSHVEQTKELQSKVSADLQTEKRLETVRDRLHSAKDKISLKEGYINNQFDQKKESYKKLKEELTAIEQAYAAKTETNAKLTAELAGITQQLDSVKAAMNDRGNSMTDTSPLVQIKQALKQIKQDIVNFDLQIGVVGHTLLQHKLRHGNPDDHAKGYKMRGKIKSAPSNDEDDAASTTAPHDFDDDDDHNSF